VIAAMKGVYHLRRRPVFAFGPREWTNRG
jgi:hypothetical protein